MNGTKSLVELLAVFDRQKVPYMVVGSYSSNFYGIPRSTEDADLVVHLPSAKWVNLPAILPVIRKSSSTEPHITIAYYP